MKEDAFNRAINHFNAEEFREALLAFEELWVIERSDFLKALIQICNALHQLRLGLVTAPRMNLTTADALLTAYTPAHLGLDVAVLRGYLALVRAMIPDNLQTGEGSIPWENIPRLHLRIAPTS